MASDFKFTDDFGWISSFVRSTAESVPEVFGVTPTTETLQWRQDHPVSALASEFAGMAVPYAGWYGALTKVPKLAKIAKTIDKLGDAVNKPISTGFKREVLKLAPFEAGRLATSQVIGDQTFAGELGSSIFNLAAAGGVGGVLSGFAAAGLRDPSLPSIFPGLDIAAPVALQARHMKMIVDSGQISPDLMPKANLALKTAMSASRTEELTKSYRYVGELTGDKTSPFFKGLPEQLNRWFRPTEMPGGKSLQIRKFSSALEKDFPNPESWMAEAELAGIDKDVWAKGQYFRSISFHPEKASQFPKVVDNKLTKGMTPIGGNWFLARETDEGMFVMAKKYIGEPGKADPTDKWLLFKTDQPGHFVPDNQRWAEAAVANTRWMPEAIANKDGGIVFNAIDGFKKEFPFRNYLEMSEPTRMQRMIDKLTPQGVKNNELVQRAKEAMRANLTPRLWQFTKAPRANHIATASKMGYTRAEQVVNELMNGTVKVDPGQQLFFNALDKTTGPLGLDPLRPALSALRGSPDWENVFANFIRKGKTIEDADKAYAAGDLSETGLKALKSLQAANLVTTSNITKAEKAVGKKPTDWLAGHYGWSHVWEGDTRIPILNAKGQTVHISGGPNKRAAQKDAEAYLKEHPEMKLGQAYSKSQLMKDIADKKVIAQELEPALISPSFVLERSGVTGYKWYNKTPTVEEFLEEYEKHLLSRWKYQANLAVDDVLASDLNALAREDPAAFQQVVSRLNADAGVQGNFGAMVNRATDEVLAPFIGNESATKIVGYTNTALYNFQLGAMNLSFPAVNLATFVQTTLPEVAFMLTAPAARRAPYYTPFAVAGSKGPSGIMSVLQPLKLASIGLKEMRKPSADTAEAVAWALNNRTLEPRLHEEYIGAASTKVTDLYRLMKGEIGRDEFKFGSWVRAFSEWLPANSERLARTHTFVMGFRAARDLLTHPTGRELTIEEAARIAQQLTNRTMYLYTAADKPKVLTSPVGSGLGLFKNWMFHYMAQMGQYSKEAFLHGNIAPLAWQTAGTFAMGGLASTPIYWAANLFSKAFTGNDAMKTIYDEMGVSDGWFDPADGMMYGLPAMLTGVSLYSQVSAPGSNPSRDAASLFDAVIYDRMNAAQRAVGTAFDHWQVTGNHPAKDPKVRMLFARAFAPATVQRWLSVGADGSIVSPMSGYPIVQDMSFYQQMLYKMKLNPVEVDKAYAVSDKLYKQREERRATVAQLGEAYANAMMANNSAEQSLILRQATVWGVDLSSVFRSANARISKKQEDIVERGYRPVDIAVYEQVLKR